MLNKYDNFFLPVNDLDKARDFYKELGMSVKFDFSDKGMLAFNVGNEEPAIILKDIGKFQDAKSTIWFVVESVKSECQKMKEKGIKFNSEPFEIKTGLAVEFDDPFGNRLGITDYSLMK